jgi:phosphomannomutase
MAMHPEAQAALDRIREFTHALNDMVEQIGHIRARRPSPSGAVIPEVDGVGRLTDLYIASGTIVRFSNTELVVEIMAAIRESTADAARQRVHMLSRTPLAGEPVSGTPSAGAAGTAGQAPCS